MYLTINNQLINLHSKEKTVHSKFSKCLKNGANLCATAAGTAKYVSGKKGFLFTNFLLSGMCVSCCPWYQTYVDAEKQGGKYIYIYINELVWCLLFFRWKWIVVWTSHVCLPNYPNVLVKKQCKTEVQYWGRKSLIIFYLLIL